MFQNKKIEIACFHLESVLLAQKAGADRIELCANISVGGTTPSINIIQQALEKITIDCYVMIRPRGGNFVYSDAEFELMKSEIKTIKKLGANGFVFGILNKDNTINIQQNKVLVALAHPLPCTFHKAFDEVSNHEKALEDVISCRFSTLLTSGTATNVMHGKEIIKQLINQANHRIQIMPGGSLRSSNISNLDQIVQANWYHSSAITDHSEIANSSEITALKAHLSKK